MVVYEKNYITCQNISLIKYNTYIWRTLRLETINVHKKKVIDILHHYDNIWIVPVIMYLTLLGKLDFKKL